LTYIPKSPQGEEKTREGEGKGETEREEDWGEREREREEKEGEETFSSVRRPFVYCGTPTT
jgi:hypothetical protein